LRPLFVAGWFPRAGAGNARRGRTHQKRARDLRVSGLPAGTYAVAVFHAEHNEAQMETGLFGKPKQGYGFSRNPSSAFGPPSFASAAFDYKGGSMNLPVRLSY
jgi:uncharacterized protein (DUF2141 family)